VWKTREPKRIKGITSASSTGNMAWLAICEATTLSRNTKAAARQISVVVPTAGLMPITMPAAMLQASARGLVPMRSSARIGNTPRR
jgi:hypothetical protein